MPCANAGNGAIFGTDRRKTMIKLIATDLDGTLLDADGKMPDGVFEAIEKLHRRGILFCAASGRQLAGLRELFRPVADKIVYAAENGALIAYGGETLHIDVIPKEKVLRVLDAVKKAPDAHPLLCTPDKAYYGEYAQPFVRFVQLSYISNAQRDLYEAAEREAVCKIAVYDGRSPEKNCMKLLPPLLTDLRLTQSGGNWLDVSEKSANKGNAMRFLQKKFSLSADECAAFGDHMNDYEMLLACGHPYLPANAYPRLTELLSGAVIVPSNVENGVLRALNAIAEGKPLPTV